MANYKEAQTLLKQLGYYSGSIDGIWGIKSREAMGKWLVASGNLDLEPDGQLDALRKAASGSVSEKTAGTFWDEIKHFSKEEFRCKCGGKYCSGFPAEPQEQLIRCADEMRAYFGKPITVTSGLRCQTWNDMQPGSVSNSRHISGKAMDIYVQGIGQSSRLESWLEQKKAAGTLRYWYHIGGGYYHMDIL